MGIGIVILFWIIYGMFLYLLTACCKSRRGSDCTDTNERIKYHLSVEWTVLYLNYFVLNCFVLYGLYELFYFVLYLCELLE
jgi:amino acid permease